MSVDNKAVQLIAGAAGGVAGSIVTAPLDVAKTRLQSSMTSSYATMTSQQQFASFQSMSNQSLRCMSTMTYPTQAQCDKPPGLVSCIRHIVRTEGYRALFKGLGPTIIGAAPSRAIYFAAYNHFTKTFTDLIKPTSQVDYSKVHLLSAASAGFVCTTTTNPIWMIRTRLQLNNKAGSRYSAVQCIRSVYQQHGIRGFYKGLVASYFGITETTIHFVLYEALKAKIAESRKKKLLEERSQMAKSFSGDCNFAGGMIDGEEAEVFDVEKDAMKNLGPLDFLKYMGAAAVCKTFATCAAYPHEVVRTRLREENSRYKTFTGTIVTVFREEGYRGLYRGLGTQLIKHIPNTAIVFVTYEVVVNMFHKNGF